MFSFLFIYYSINIKELALPNNYRPLCRSCNEFEDRENNDEQVNSKDISRTANIFRTITKWLNLEERRPRGKNSTKVWITQNRNKSG